MLPRVTADSCLLALNALGHERAQAVAADIALEKKSRWRQVTEKRNSSFLLPYYFVPLNPLGLACLPKPLAKAGLHPSDERA